MNFIKKKNNLILGTANFGNVKYGLNENKLSINQINKIIRFATKRNIRFFDTAISYNSENKLNNKKIQIFTKLLPIKENLNYINKIEIEKIINFSINKSLKNLGVKKIFCLMLHRVDDLKLLNEYVVKVLKKYQNNKIINHIGISIDKFENIDRIVFNKDIKFIQIPINIYDQRWKIFLKKKYKKKMKNKILIARSIYLQGLLFKKKWPKKIQKYKNIIFKVNKNLLFKMKIKNIEELMYKYVNSLNQIKFILFGTSTIKSIEKNIKNLKEKKFNSKEISLIEKSTKKVNKEFYNIIEWHK